MILARTFFIIMAFSLALSAGSKAQKAQGNTVIVFAAASLKNALDDIEKKWAAETGNTAKISYGASSALARQLEQDAPAEIFISADQDWMDYAVAKGVINTTSQSDLLRNRLVLIAAKDNALILDLKSDVDLASALKGGRLAMANVDAVPAGKYGKAALKKLKIWECVAKSVAQAENVRAALVLVSRGEAPLGIVYQTDAQSDPNVRIVATFPEEAHQPIVYPIALTKKATVAARSLLSYIKSTKAGPSFAAQGFTVLTP